jgi:hypothetical protein
MVGLLLFFTSQETFSEVPPVVEHKGHIFKFEPKDVINIIGCIELNATKNELSCKNCLSGKLLKYKDILEGKKEEKYINKYPFVKFDISVTALKKRDSIDYKIAQEVIKKHLIYSTETPE